MTIAITPGEPAGVGPELILQLAQKRDCRDWVVVADPDLMAQRAQQLGLTKIDLVQWQPGSTRLPGQSLPELEKEGCFEKRRWPRRGRNARKYM